MQFQPDSERNIMGGKLPGEKHRNKIQAFNYKIDQFNHKSVYLFPTHCLILDVQL